jgi:hypothetical protein
LRQVPAVTDDGIDLDVFIKGSVSVVVESAKATVGCLAAIHHPQVIDNLILLSPGFFR